MTLAELKKIIQDKYLHTSKPMMKKCDCTHLIKGTWDSCEICGHPNSAHNTGICGATWEEGGYTLSSGAKSVNYFDIKGMMGDYDHMCRLLNELSKKLPRYDTFACLGGCELGGVPLVSALWTSEQMYEYSVCYIRKSINGVRHGMQKEIEGKPQTPILLVDDVITTGHTISDAAWTCIEEGWGQPCGVLCVIDRLTEQDRSQCAVKPIYSLFKESDFE